MLHRLRALRSHAPTQALAALLAAATLFTAATGCERQEPAQDKLRVAVSIPPLLALAQDMLPEGAEAILLMPPGASPHGYEPKPGDIAALAGADLVLLNGLGVDGVFEAAAAALADRAPRLLRLAELEGVAAIAVDEHEHVHSEACEHGDLDPHLWLDPLLIERFIPVLAEALRAEIDEPAARAQVDERSTALAARVRALHEEFEAKLAPLAEAGFIAEHPAYGRLAARYHLRQVGTMRPLAQLDPTPAVVQELVELLRSGEARAIYVEPQFPSATADRLSELTGAPVLTLDPLGEGDWFAMMRANLDALVEGLTPQP